MRLTDADFYDAVSFFESDILSNEQYDTLARSWDFFIKTGNRYPFQLACELFYVPEQFAVTWFTFY